MKSEWRVSWQYVNDRKIYQVYRLIDTNKVHYSGNREEYGVIFYNAEEANLVAKKLNIEGE